jgi:hypothetical protein
MDVIQAILPHAGREPLLRDNATGAENDLHLPAIVIQDTEQAMRYFFWRRQILEQIATEVDSRPRTTRPGLALGVNAVDVVRGVRPQDGHGIPLTHPNPDACEYVLG